MGLPKLDQPVYRHTLQGLGKEIKYRSFTVKEQKILLHAKESEDAKQIIDAINQIVGNCIIDDVDPEKLAYFDVEDIFLRIRSKSVSNVVEIPYRVKDTDERITVKVDLDNVSVKSEEDHTKKIMITDTVGVIMQYPTIVMLRDGSNDNNDLVRQCIEQVFTPDEVMLASDYSKEEMEEFMDQFDVTALTKIDEFFKSMPKVRHEVNIRLKDGTEDTIKFEGIQDLFT